MNDWIVRLLAILAGFALAIQPPINARLRTAVGHPLWASVISFVVGTVGILMLAIATRAPFPTLTPGVPWWAWTGGFCGVVYVAIALVVVPRIGAAALLSLVVLGMMVAAIAIDQTGAFGVAVRQTTLMRVLGAASVVAGAVLVSRY